MTVSLVDMLIDSTVKVSLIVVFALAATALLGKRSAAVRHWVLAATIVCAAVMPALALVAPSWHVPFAALSAGRLEPAARGVFTPLAPNDDPAAVSDTLSSPRARQSQVGGIDVGTVEAIVLWLTRIWMAGVALAFGTLLVGLGRLNSIASRAHPVSAGMWVDRVAAISAEYGLRRRVVLLESEHPTLLVTWGIRRPTVILPRGASAWRDDRAHVVLGHELGHIRRSDWVWHMLAQMVRCLHWFNPLVWLVCKRLRVESERACDDAVLNLGVQGPEYATHLLDLARAARAHQISLLTGSAALAIARPSSLEARITAMLNGRLNRNSVTRSARVVTALAILIAAVTIAGLGASAQTAFATFSGIAVDQFDRILPNVPLVLTNLQNNAKYEVLSDTTGRFEFVGLPPAVYSLENRYPGFEPRQGRLTMTGQDVQQNVKLQIGGVEETVTIKDDGAPSPAPAHFQRSPLDLSKCAVRPTGGNIRQPVKLFDVHVQYPPHLRGTGIAGVVTIEGKIGADGLMNSLRTIGPAQPDLANAALEGVQQWQYRETLLDCIPVEVAVRVTVNFLVPRTR